MSDYHAQEERDEETYANRPSNHGRALPFSDLYLSIFNPLNDVRKKPTGPMIARKKLGPHGARNNESPSEARIHIVERFISKWRQKVGNDIYPAFRLIVPDKDRERAMYGLKEKTIGKLLVRILKIDKNSEDGFNLLNWKLPGQRFSSSMAGDFAGRCFEVIHKRAMRIEPGPMDIDQVNVLLDRLSLANKEDEQLPILQEFYSKMNAEEMMWLIRMILRQMKIGATERTLFHIWHPDAELLFNVSSNLRRVCWELYDPKVRLHQEQSEINPMSCFQPQLAQFQMHSFQKLISCMRPTDSDRKFWIEEKLDGERMQLHMVEDEDHPGGMRFGFWSRKAKEYTYLYGSGYLDTKSALTRHLKDAFNDNVFNIILDGEMVTWDMERDKIVDFGTLKTAAIAEQNNEFAQGHRPLYRVFDILFLNDKALTKYTLRDRRNALKAAVKGVHRRLEIQPYEEGETEADIEPHLRRVIEEAGEGLVIKNPRSMYRLNERNDDWIKVKPEYMNQFGEELDCVVIGGYYGSGRRGGGLSSFLCGLKASPRQIARGYEPGCVLSFCKVGGGMTASDYAAIKHLTDGKWIDWNKKRPPASVIRLDPLSHPGTQPEKPDVWINPEDSFVMSVKAASILYAIKEFAVGYTLRFPRFRRLRSDKSFATSMTVDEFEQQRDNMEKEKRDRQFVLDNERRQRQKRSVVRKCDLAVAGSETVAVSTSGPPVFEGLSLHIMTESMDTMNKMSKTELEAFVKAHGGKLFASSRAGGPTTICIADRRLVSVQGLQNQGNKSIVRPSWLFDCVRQATVDIQLGREALLLPYEPRHMYFVSQQDHDMVASAVDRLGDSYSLDLPSSADLSSLLAGIFLEESRSEHNLLDDLETRHPLHDIQNKRAHLFKGCVAFLPDYIIPRVKSTSFKNESDDAVKPEPDSQAAFPSDSPSAMDTAEDEEAPSKQNPIAFILASSLFQFGGGDVSQDLSSRVSHVLVDPVSTSEVHIADLRRQVAKRAKAKVPWLVSMDWVQACWDEGTLVDEQRYAVS